MEIQNVPIAIRHDGSPSHGTTTNMAHPVFNVTKFESDAHNSQIRL